MTEEKALPTSILGRTGLEVTRLGFGTAANQRLDEDQWAQVLNGVLDARINFIDTSNDYGLGWHRPSEEMIGKHIGHRRSEFILATKCGCSPPGSSPTDHIWTRDNVFRGVHESLKRMRTEYLDVVQFHNPTVQECEADDVVEALQDLRREGKVRWIGMSTTLPELATYLQWGVFDVFQLPYSALERDHEGWITRAAEAGVGVIIRGGAAQGGPSTSPNNADHWQKFDQAGIDDLRDANESRAVFILRYTLTHPDAHTIIVGTMNVSHLQENSEATLRGPLTNEVYDEVNRRMDAVGVRPTPVSD